MTRDIFGLNAATLGALIALDLYGGREIARYEQFAHEPTPKKEPRAERRRKEKAARKQRRKQRRKK